MIEGYQYTPPATGECTLIAGTSNPAYVVERSTIMTTKDSPTDVPISQRVIEQVAEETNTDPIDLEPLFTRIDPDALDALFSNGAGATVRAEGEVTFPMGGCEVTVDASGAINVEPQGEHQGVLATGRADARTSPAETPD